VWVVHLSPDSECLAGDGLYSFQSELLAHIPSVICYYYYYYYYVVEWRSGSVVGLDQRS